MEDGDVVKLRVGWLWWGPGWWVGGEMEDRSEVGENEQCESTHSTQTHFTKLQKVAPNLVLIRIILKMV